MKKLHSCLFLRREKVTMKQLQYVCTLAGIPLNQSCTKASQHKFITPLSSADCDAWGVTTTHADCLNCLGVLSLADVRVVKTAWSESHRGPYPLNRQKQSPHVTCHVCLNKIHPPSTARYNRSLQNLGDEKCPVYVPTYFNCMLARPINIIIL
jgi:hypothetical protein